MVALFHEFRPDGVMHLAAESHVDRSISSSRDFIETNVLGTHTLLEVARDYWVALRQPEKDAFRFLSVSTDEVYGSLGVEGKFTEQSPCDPSSPASSSTWRPSTTDASACTGSPSGERASCRPSW